MLQIQELWQQLNVVSSLDQSLTSQSVANPPVVPRSGTRRVYLHLKHSTPCCTILSLVHCQLDYIIIILDYIILDYIILYIIYIS